jgi:2-hydroxy-3-keto-5-methylthiopentenyl-1-phosphate phosphatase
VVHDNPLSAVGDGAPAPRLVLDWDGTCTEVDGLHMLLDRFGDRDVFDRMEGVLGDGLTLHEVIAAELATVTAPLEQAVAWLLDHVTLRPGFHELARVHRPTIVSGGFHELIEPVLAREGVDLPLLANAIDARPDGWLPLWRDEAVCATCGEACKRGVLAGAPYVYVGDGYSDRCAALVAERVFARDGLARWLGSEGVPYERFEDLDDVLAALG